MKILLTGATGFTGSHVLEQLVAMGHRPRCLVRPSSSDAQVRRAGGETVRGDLGDEMSLTVAMDGVDTLLNIASMGFGHMPGLVSAAERAGLQRAIFISTTAIFTSLNAKSKAVRIAAEKCVRESALKQTILRPTMIYGTSRDRNMARLIRFLRNSPIVPVVGSGRNLQQPVYVQDVASAVVASMESEETIGRTYNIAGAAPLTFLQVISTITGLLDRTVLRLHLPVLPVVTILRLAERVRVRMPLKQEQILRLNEDKAFDYSDAARDFGYAPIPFEEGIRRQISEMYP